MRRLFPGWRRCLLLGFRMQGIGFMQEVAEFTFADDQRFLRDWFDPADSAALTPAPRLAESDLRHSLSRGRERVGGNS